MKIPSWELQSPGERFVTPAEHKIQEQLQWKEQKEQLHFTCIIPPLSQHYSGPRQTPWAHSFSYGGKSKVSTRLPQPFRVLPKRPSPVSPHPFYWESAWPHCVGAAKNKETSSQSSTTGTTLLEYTFLSSTRGTFSRIERMLNYKTRLNKF